MEQKTAFNKHEVWVDYDLAPDYMAAVVKLAEQLNTEGKVRIKYYDHGNGATVEYYDPILNITQHVGTAAQEEMGLIEPSEGDKEAIRSLITFEDLPEIQDIVRRVNSIVDILDNNYNVKYVLIGGAGYLMSTLVAGLKHNGYRPVHSFSKRIVRECIDNDTGKVTKQSLFEHIGWVKDFVVD